MAPTIDIEGLPRPVGAQFDIGAYEWRSVSVAGDYNGNGAVDAADYALWRNTLGSNVTPFTGADGDGSGTIDAGDYLYWRANFSATTGASAGVAGQPVPEPLSIPLLIGALLPRFPSMALKRLRT